MDIKSYLAERNRDIRKRAGSVKDFSVFDLNYLPEQPIVRDEFKTLVDALVHYDISGIPHNLALFGSRGSGKTLMVRHLAEVIPRHTSLRLLYCNARNHNTSFKILAHLTQLPAKGYAFNDLFDRFQQLYPDRTVLILDETDLMSSKDRGMEILYWVSRCKAGYMVILLSNNPRMLSYLDPSARSSLQPEVLHFKNYNAEQVYAILQQRAQSGLKEYEEEPLRKIAALTVKNTNADVRVGIKGLYYTATEPGLDVEQAFERASRDIVYDVVQDLNDRCLLMLEAARRTESGLVKEVYERYRQLSQTVGESPFSYVHFYNNLSYLQSLGLILMLSTKVSKTYTNRIQLLCEPRVAADTHRMRFGQDG